MFHKRIDRAVCRVAASPEEVARNFEGFLRAESDLRPAMSQRTVAVRRVEAPSGIVKFEELERFLRVRFTTEYTMQPNRGGGTDISVDTRLRGLLAPLVAVENGPTESAAWAYRLQRFIEDNRPAGPSI